MFAVLTCRNKTSAAADIRGYSRIKLQEASAKIRADPWLMSYPAKPFTNSTKLRRAIPDGPFAIHGF